MAKVQISSEKAKQILHDARINLVQRLEANVGQGNWNQRPVNEALDAIDWAHANVGRQLTHIFNDSGYALDTLIKDRDSATRVRRVLKHVNSAYIFVSPESLRYSPWQLNLGIDDTRTKWAAEIPEVDSKVRKTLDKGVIVHDLNGFSGIGFAELEQAVQSYFNRFHRYTKQLRETQKWIAENRAGYAVLATGSGLGALIGVVVGSALDVTHTYNFHTQLGTRFLVAMSETAGAGIRTIADFGKNGLDWVAVRYEPVARLRDSIYEEPVVKDVSDDAKIFGKWGLVAPIIPASILETDELLGLGWRENKYFEGGMYVANNNINNLVALLGIAINSVKKNGLKEGLSEFSKNPLLWGNLATTLSLLAILVGTRIKGYQVDTGLESGAEAGGVSFDTPTSVLLAGAGVLALYEIRNIRLITNPNIRKQLYKNHGYT